MKTILCYHSRLPDCQNLKDCPTPCRGGCGEAGGLRLAEYRIKLCNTIARTMGRCLKKSLMGFPLFDSTVPFLGIHSTDGVAQYTVASRRWVTGAVFVMGEVWNLPKSQAMNCWLDQVRYFSVEGCKDWEKPQFTGLRDPQNMMLYTWSRCNKVILWIGKWGRPCWHGSAVEHQPMV